MCVIAQLSEFIDVLAFICSCLPCLAIRQVFHNQSFDIAPIFVSHATDQCAGPQHGPACGQVCEWAINTHVYGKAATFCSNITSMCVVIATHSATRSCLPGSSMTWPTSMAPGRTRSWTCVGHGPSSWPMPDTYGWLTHCWHVQFPKATIQLINLCRVVCEFEFSGTHPAQKDSACG